MRAPRNAPPAPRSFDALLSALTQPAAFPCDVRIEGPIPVVQTHASAVLLTAERAYKLKKPRNFGFLDYSTARRRRHFCALEARLNQALAPEVYLGVAPVTQSPDGAVRFADILPPDALPQPGARLADARVLDYAVVMRRLPEAATLAALVRAGAVEPVALTEIAQRIAAYHTTHPASDRHARYGGARALAANWAENFAQVQSALGRTLDAASDERIRAYVERFLAERGPLLRSRVREGRVRDCHGDLRMEHVYRLATPEPPGYRFVFVDRIEFLDRFRYGDVAGEVAFLAMELDSVGRPDLRRAFVEAYIAASGDDALRELLPFYACYRAYVRGKVRSFQLDEPETPPAEREAARTQAQALFALAARYAATPPGAQLILIGGLMGAGKSTLAEMLRVETGAVVISSDVTRKRLAGIDTAQPVPAAFGADIYTAEWHARVYSTMLTEARAALAAGRSVILDASFARRAQRQQAARIAGAAGVTVRFIEAVCPPELTLARLARRWNARIASAGSDVAQASDGRPELYAAQAAAWEPYDAQREAGMRYALLDTSAPATVLRERLLVELGLPHDVCWLADPNPRADTAPAPPSVQPVTAP